MLTHVDLIKDKLRSYEAGVTTHWDLGFSRWIPIQSSPYSVSRIFLPSDFLGSIRPWLFIHCHVCQATATISTHTHTHTMNIVLFVLTHPWICLLYWLSKMVHTSIKYWIFILDWCPLIQVTCAGLVPSVLETLEDTAPFVDRGWCWLMLLDV